MDEIIKNLETLEENWMHKTKCEKIEEIREALIDMANDMWDRNIGGDEPQIVIQKVNELMKKLKESVVEG
ncbi:hypothetical protein SAMN04487977_101543 [Treponema bryantii]|uniref:Uncharacterized protein n=1 Tax=Treponema bryantii TaxID=163 RepID=A0A1H9B1D4_9SPIR|nr:hypothetical protein [Treponema bryantii]SEP82764.1 hypothetical protein SAMN04487977_101543 [Treponema bryantii]